MTTALRALIAIIALLTGVAAGLVDGVSAATTPIGLAYLTMPLALSSSMMPTDLARKQIAQGAEGLALVLDDLVGDVAEPGIGDGERGKLAGMLGLIDRPRQRADRFVGALLADVAEACERCARAPHHLVNDRLVVELSPAISRPQS